MGSIVGAAVALEWDDAEIKERLRNAFVNTNPVNDYTLPFLSLIKGRKVARLLEQNFGGLRTWPGPLLRFNELNSRDVGSAS